MQTILGATGQIAVELARELRRTYTGDLRLVSRNPRKVNDTDTLVPADLLDARQAAAAVAGSSIVYFTAGLPPDTALWEAQFPVMLRNALEATRAAGAKFVYFDNTYMYPQDDRAHPAFAADRLERRVLGQHASSLDRARRRASRTPSSSTRSRLARRHACRCETTRGAR